MTRSLLRTPKSERHSNRRLAARPFRLRPYIGPLIAYPERTAGMDGCSRRILLKKSAPEGFLPALAAIGCAAQAVTGPMDWVAGGSLICRLVPSGLCTYGYGARWRRFDQLGQLA